MALSDEACKEQFETAIDMTNRFVHAYDVDDYFFGRISGLSLLNVIPSDTEHPTALDIGAGYGLFLKECLNHSDSNLRAIGITAHDSRHTDDERIEWVFGDFQRPDTWRPQETLQPSSVDLAVASLTFQHFADPIRGLQNAIKLLKPNGHLFVDHMHIKCHPETAEKTVDVIIAALSENEGEYGFGHEHSEEFSTLAIFGLHFQNRTGIEPFRIQPIGERNGSLVYTSEQ